MKRIAIALLLASLTGCAGLSVNFDAGITYRSAVPAGGRLDAPVPPPLPPGKAS